MECAYLTAYLSLKVIHSIRTYNHEEFSGKAFQYTTFLFTCWEFSDSSSSSILITTIITSFVLIQYARAIHHWKWNKDNVKMFSIKERELIIVFQCFTIMIIIIDFGDFGRQKAPFGIFTDFDTMAWSPTILQPLFDPKYVKPISLLLKLKRLLNTLVIKLAIYNRFNIKRWLNGFFTFLGSLISLEWLSN